MLENMLRAMQMRYMDDMPKARYGTGRATTTTKEKKAGYLTSIQTPSCAPPCQCAFRPSMLSFAPSNRHKKEKKEKNTS
jgi:hypothetical protein